MAPVASCWALALCCVLASATRLRRSPASYNEAYVVPLTNHQNVQYTAPIDVGGQQLPVIYDTGSFEVIVLSTLCPQCAQDHEVYDRSKSSSFATGAGTEMVHIFGSGPVLSRKGLESLRIGGSGSPYGLAQMPFWQVVSHNITAWHAGTAHFSGIVGLGHSDRVPEGYGEEGTRDQTLLAAAGVESFAVCLERGHPSAPGRLVFGAGAGGPGFSTLQVKGQVHWAVQMTDLNAPGISTTLCGSPSCGAIIDSGTSLLAAPPSAAPFLGYLAGLVRRDCSNLHELPALRFKLDGVPIELPPSAYVMRVRNSGTWDKLFGRWQDGPAEQCTPAFMEIEKSSQMGPVWILGMPFLRHYYTIFDRAANQIHIQKSQANCEPQPPGAGVFGAKSTPPGVTSFSAEDYEPTAVDLDGATLPSWATASGEQLSM